MYGGIHSRSTAFELSAEDSGTPEAPVVYAAAPDEIPIVSGMAALRPEWFVPVSDQEVLSRVIDPAARERLLQCDLRAHGITDFGQLSRRGHDVTPPEITKTPPPELYVNGTRMTRARWPNPDDHFPQFLRGVQQSRHGVVGRAGIVDPGPTADDADFLDRGGTIRYAFDRPARWTLADDLWLSGVFSWSWEWSFNRVSAIDVPSQTITLRYGERSRITDQYSHDYFFAENLLEEIDQPGEYFLDRTTGTLFLLPPNGFGGNDTAVCLSMLSAPLVRLSNVSHIRHPPQRVHRLHNSVSDGNVLCPVPGFLDASSGNFTLRNNTEVTHHIPGFPDIDFDAIGSRQPSSRRERALLPRQTRQ